MSLRDGEILLRPMTEDDWPVLHKWNSDPEVLYYSEGSDVAGWSLAEVQDIYLEVEQFRTRRTKRGDKKGQA